MPVSNSPPVAVAVWAMEPLFVQVMVWPAEMVTSGGVKPQELMSEVLPSVISTVASAKAVDANMSAASSAAASAATGARRLGTKRVPCTRSMLSASAAKPFQGRCNGGTERAGLRRLVALGGGAWRRSPTGADANTFLSGRICGRRWRRHVHAREGRLAAAPLRFAPHPLQG